MSDISPKLNLPLIAPSQALKHVTHNEALLRLDAITQLSVEALGVTTPPNPPVEGACYGLGLAAQGEWAGHDGDIALFFNAGWQFLTPQPGWRAWDISTAQIKVFTAGQWLAIDLSLDNVEGVGINSSYDAVNRLALSSEASLFNHAGAGHQLKINKASAADTASLLFQSAFSGHAEIGLAGTTDLVFKVSDDGSNFTTALSARAQDGLVEVPCLRSGMIVIAANAVASLIPPGPAGMVFISQVNPGLPQVTNSGIFAYDTGSSPDLLTLVAGSGFENLGVTSLSGTTGLADRTSIAVQSGAIQLENRYIASGDYSYTFLNS